MAGPVRISILADGSSARREIARTVGSARSAFGGLAAAAGLSAGIAGVVGLGKASVAVEKEFSQNMALIGAATNAPAKQLDKLSSLAIKLGADTSFSANEAADAMLELAKSGLSPATIQAGALEGTLTLAAAGGTDLATAATVASNALNTFGLAGKDMAAVAAALAGGANASSASVESLAQGLSQVGPGAKNAGLSLQETVAALSAFDAAGIKGSDAGTSLKTMLSRLVPQTDKARDAMRDLGLDFTNADGSFKSIEQVAGILQARMGQLSQEQRTTALSTIFGSDATRAASVLIDQGARGLRKYIKATNDQGAAQKLAEARMSGTAGALERLSGAAETAQLRIGQALAPAVVVAADALGNRLVPAAEDAIRAGGSLIKAYKADGLDGVIDRVDKLVGAQGRLSPVLNEGRDAVEGLWRIVKQLAPAFLDATNELSPLLSPLKLVGEVANAVAAVLEVIPDGLLSVGIQAGVAALILPKLAAATTAVASGMATATARALSFGLALGAIGTPAQAAALARLGAAAKGAAGIGGILALSQAAQQADTNTALLLGTVGGAALGFSVAGPWGALIGGAAGAALGKFSSEAKKANAAAEAGEKRLRDYASSLDAITGATTEATRATAQKNLFDSGALKTLADYGVSARTAVNAALGQADASAVVQSAIARETEAVGDLKLELGLLKGVQANAEVDARRQELEAEIARREKATQSVKDETIAVRESIETKKEEIAATRSYAGLLKGLPTGLKTQIRADGIRPTIAAVSDLAAGYGRLDRRQIRTLIKAAGIEPTRKDIDRISARLAGLNKQRVDLVGFKQSFTRSIGDFRNQADRGGKDVGRKLGAGTRNAKPDVAGFLRSLNGGINQGKSSASDGSRGIGANLKSGFSSGFAGADGLWSGSVRGAVRSAINAGKAEARIKSPSKETFYIGEMMGKGFEEGMDARKKGAKKSGRDLVAAALAGVVNGSDGVSKALDALTRLVEKQIDFKDQGKEAAREKAVLKGLRDEYAALRKVGKEQDRNAAKLEKARDRYKQLVSESKAYAASIKAGFVDYGSVIALGQGNGFANSDQLIDQLRARLENAKRFAALIKQLSGSLNATSLQQLIDAGVEGGLGTAEAIVAGGASAIGQINNLTAQIASAGGNLGNQMADKFKLAGIQAAAGLVRGIESQQARLDRVAERMANALAKAVKKALGIKSPSRVFAGIGRQTIQGLAAGLDETYVKHQGINLAAALETGFARPTLGAGLGPTGAGVAQYITVKVEVAPGANPVEVGRQITKALDAYKRSGGRSAA